MLTWQAGIVRGTRGREFQARLRAFPDGAEVEIDVGGAAHRVRYELPGPPPPTAADALLAACLLPAMREGATLRIDEPVSPRLLQAIPTIQEIFVNWQQRFPIYSRYARTSVEAPARVPRSRVAERTAAFFTGGVDSFYTVLRHREEIDSLLLVHGFDFSLENGEKERRIMAGVRAAAHALGKPLVEVRTDLRSFTDGYAHWEAYHGAALASVALLLSSNFAKVYLPATLTYSHLIPLGSHPLLDPLWSTEELQLVHDGCEASRLEKLALISKETAARTWLRVCWENRNGRYNCGSCEKCLRTMVAMKALGLLDLFDTFPHEIDAAAIARVQLPIVRYTWEASLQLLEESRADPVFARALRQQLYGPKARLIRRATHYRQRIEQLAAR